jgi:hypothetical protein
MNEEKETLLNVIDNTAEDVMNFIKEGAKFTISFWYGLWEFVRSQPSN